MRARLTLPTPMPAPLPDADALRRAALAASWRRDRRVGMRRLAWRYTQWALMRYVAPAVAVVVLGFGAWLLLSRPEPLFATPPAATPPEPTEPGLVLRLDLQPTPPASAPAPAADPSSNPPGRNAP